MLPLSLVASSSRVNSLSHIGTENIFAKGELYGDMRVSGYPAPVLKLTLQCFAKISNDEMIT